MHTKRYVYVYKYTEWPRVSCRIGIKVQVGQKYAFA